MDRRILSFQAALRPSILLSAFRVTARGHRTVDAKSLKREREGVSAHIRMMP
jgi:hypothetical protein